FQAEDGIRDFHVTGVQTCALPISRSYAADLDRAVAAWADPAAWDGEIAGTPAADTAAMMILELALHGWDVARAVGEEYRLSPDCGRFVLETVEGVAEMYRRYDGFAAPEIGRASSRVRGTDPVTPYP